MPVTSEQVRQLPLGSSLPEVNYVQFARNVLECTFGFEYDPIIVDFTVRKVCRLPLKNVKWEFKCL